MRFESLVLSVVYPIGDHGVLSGLLSVMPLCLLQRRVAPLSVASLESGSLEGGSLKSGSLVCFLPR